MPAEFSRAIDRFFNQPISSREALRRIGKVAVGTAAISLAIANSKPVEAQEYRFDYTAPQERQLIQCAGAEIDGKFNQRWWLNPSYTPWLYRNWGPMHNDAAQKWGLTRWFERGIGVLDKYDALHEAITGVRSHSRDQAQQMANDVLAAAPDHYMSWGHCGLVASAQALDVEPRRWFGSRLYGVPLTLDDQKGMLAASYCYVGGYNVLSKPGEDLSAEQKVQNIPLMLEMYKQGWPVVVDRLMDGETSGSWFRAVNGVREDGQVVSVSRLGLEPHDVHVSTLKSAEVVFHLMGPDQGFDPKWAEMGRPYWLTEMRVDIARHASFGTSLV